jgi:hypothetical protein
VLGRPDLEHAKSAVLNSLTSPDAQRGYRHVIAEFVDWYCAEPRLAFNRTVVLRYRSHLDARHLAPGTINLRLGVVRRPAHEAAECGLITLNERSGRAGRHDRCQRDSPKAVLEPYYLIDNLAAPMLSK